LAARQDVPNGGDVRGRLPGCRARPVIRPHAPDPAFTAAGRPRHIREMRSRRYRVVTRLERAGNRLIRAGWAPCVRPAGDDRPPYRPPLLRSSPDTLAHRRAQPVIGVAGCRTQGREACSVARALQPSVVVVEDVDLIGEERSLRDRVPQSLPGPRSPWSRSSAGTPQSERVPRQMNLSLRKGRAGSVETGAEVVAVWPHDDG